MFDTETYDLESFKLLYSRYEASFPLEQWLISVGSKLHFNPYEKLLTGQPILKLEDLRKERMEIYKSIIHNQSPREGVIEYIEVASADFNQSIAAIYKETGVDFDFTEPTVKRMGEFLEKVIQEID